MEYCDHSLRILCLNDNLCQKNAHLVSDLSRNYDFKVILNELVFYYVCITKYIYAFWGQKTGSAIIRGGAIIGTNTLFTVKRSVMSGRAMIFCTDFQ